MIGPRCREVKARFVSEMPLGAARRESRVAQVLEKRSDARANKLRVIDAAQEVFAEKGIEAEIKEIAERAGVGVGTIYRNFPTKEELVTAIVRDAMQQVHMCIEAGEREDDPIAGLRLALSGLFAITERYGWVMDAAMSGQLPAAVKAETHRKPDDPRRPGLQRILQRAVDQGRLRPDLDVQIAAAFLTGTLPPWKQALVRAGRDSEQVAEAAVDLLLRGATERE
jgi:AcrR family transcriptional regulator